MLFTRTHVAYLMSMNKINVDGVLIVEGKDDVSYLSLFVNALFFTTNGYDVSQEKIAFLKEASKVNKLIIFTDPDDAGEKIRNVLKTQLLGAFEAQCEKIVRKNQKKFGVAEMEKVAIEDALKDFVTTTETKTNNYHLSTLISLSNNPTQTREKLINKYRLIDGNNKSLENQLNILKIKPQEIEELLSGN